MIGRVRRVRLGKSLDWRYFAKRCPEYADQIRRLKKNQLALVQLHTKLVKANKIKA